MTKFKQAMQWAAAAAYALAIVVAGLGLSGCQKDECPAGTTEQWHPEPDRVDLRACVASDRSVYFCMRDLGYLRVCK